MGGVVLALNAGSSSLKFGVFEADDVGGRTQAVFRGALDGARSRASRLATRRVTRSPMRHGAPTISGTVASATSSTGSTTISAIAGSRQPGIASCMAAANSTGRCC
jgi:acetate kinase